jgi:hypothetical protein
MNASLSNDGGKKYELAQLLFANDIATLTEEEFEEKVRLIKATGPQELLNAFNSAEKANAMGVSAQLMTRFGARPGVSEISEVVFQASRYLDSNRIMPPEDAKFEQAWYTKVVPEFASDWLDDLSDTLNRMVLPTSPEYDVTIPPSLLADRQSIGLRNSLSDALESNIPAIYDTGLEDEEEG